VQGNTESEDRKRWLSAGDVILRIAGAEVERLVTLSEVLAPLRPGQKVKIEIRRRGSAPGSAAETIEAVLGRRP
jgi:S1-C subfamily serine protease